MSIRPINAMPDKWQNAKPEEQKAAPQKKAVGAKQRTFLMIKPDGVQRGLIG